MFRKGEEKLAIYGYSRVSTSNQDYKTQIRKLEEAGAEKIFSEKYTGTKKEGRKLFLILNFKLKNYKRKKKN